MQASAQKLPFTNYSSVQGLVHNRTHIIRQDGKGYMWMGTDLGICRYDGRSFRHYPCPDNPYRSARYGVAYKGKVHFGIDHFGIAICEGDSVRFVKPVNDSLTSTNGMAYLDDSTWLVTSHVKGLYKLTEKGVATFMPLPPPIVNELNLVDMYRDDMNTVWLLTSRGLVVLPDGDMRKVVQVPFFIDRYINVVRQAKNGDVYVATHTEIYKYTKAQCLKRQYDAPQKMWTMNGGITSIFFDKNDIMWMTTTFDGLVKLNMQSGVKHPYGVNNGLVSQNTWDVYLDREHNLWVATENGISKLTTDNFLSFDFSDSRYQSIKGACVWDDSTLLFSNLLDLYVYRNNTISKIEAFENLPSYIDDFLVRGPDDNLFVTVAGHRPDGHYKFNTLRYSFSHDKIHNGVSVSKLPGGHEWLNMHRGVAKAGNVMVVQSNKGLQIYKDGRFATFPLPEYNGRPLTVTSISSGIPGEVWLVDRSHDLYRYKIISGAKQDAPHLQLQERIDTRQLDNRYVSSMFADSRGYIWLCNRIHGVTRLRTDKAGKVEHIDKLPVSFFSSGMINRMCEDRWHNMWVATAAGVDKIVFTADSFYIQKDLYGSELCGKYIFFVHALGNKLLVGTTGCLGVIDIVSKEDRVPPMVHISDVRVNEKSRKELLISHDVELNADENSISFVFTGLTFKDEKKIKYSYQLEGLDRKWSTPQSAYTITYSRIPPGTYTFKVRAVSATGIWSNVPASFTFTIIQPFYTRWWFFVLVALIITAIVYAVYRYRINQLLAIQNIRQNISKDLHDDIGATVSSISIMANMAKSDLISDHKRNQFLETIQEESKYVSESLSDIVWSINPKNDSLEIMFARMQRYASELLEARNITYEFIFPNESFAGLSMDMDKRQHVYLIFKEAVNNLVKYSQASSAQIVIDVSKDVFKLVIADNGKGFDADAGHPGNGILNMKKRAADMRARLDIESESGKGTTITLLMRL